MSYKSILLTLVAAMLCESIAAQVVLSSSSDQVENPMPERTIVLTSLPWLQTSNPVAIGIDSIPNYGTLKVVGNHFSGDYRRAQESGNMNSIGFISDSYCTLPKINLYGKFGFTQQWHADRKWSDNYEPYNGNPYLAGSDLPGHYSKQLFDFSVVASSPTLWNRLWLGVAFDYKVGDFSRGDDPRSRDLLADYTIRPGVAVHFGERSRAGLNLIYRSSKEKMIRPVAKAENIDRYTYYSFTGMAEHKTSSILFFSRRYIGNYIGGEAQYNYSGDKLDLLTSASAVVRDEAVIGERKEIPGHYNAMDIEGQVISIYRGNSSLSKGMIRAEYHKGDATEYVQEEKRTTNEQGLVDVYWETLLKAIKYNDSNLGAMASWRYYRTDNKGGYKWYSGANAQYSQDSYAYILPASNMDISALNFDIDAGALLMEKGGNTLQVGIEAGYRKFLSGEYNRNASLSTDKKSIVEKNVTLPDYKFLTSDAVRAGLSVRWVFPIQSTECFLSCKAIQTFGLGELTPQKRLFVGVSLGILTD